MREKIKTIDRAEFAGETISKNIGSGAGIHIFSSRIFSSYLGNNSSKIRTTRCFVTPSQGVTKLY
jgi:hypothetical protein